MPVTRDTELTALARYSFSGRTEEDVRGDWIEPLLRLLGYGLGTRNRIERGNSLKLQPPFRAVGRKRIHFDFKPTVRGKGLWVIEAKKPVDDLFADDHLVQMWTYATDPRVDVPLGVLCDGQRLGIFDLTKVEWDVPEIDLPQASLAERFDAIEQVLGARRVAEWIRSRQLRHLRSALQAQLDLSALDQTLNDVRQMVASVRPEIESEQQEIASAAWRKEEDERKALLEKGGIEAIAQALNGPLPPIMGDIAEAVAAVERQAPQNRIRELKSFVPGASSSETGENPRPARMWWALRAVRFATAIRLTGDVDCGSFALSIAREAARDHFLGFPDDELAAAAHRFGLALGPYVVYSLGPTTGATLRTMSEQLAEEMDPADWIAANASLRLQPDHLFAGAVNLAARAAFFGAEPWTVEELLRRAESMEEQLSVNPVQPRTPRVSMGDPWLRSWLDSDPLMETTKAVLLETAKRPEDPAHDLAIELLAEYVDQ